MSYPFAKAPTVAAFIEYACTNGCELKRLKNGIKGPKGTVSVRYLFRQTKSKTYLTEPLPEDMDERLAPDTLRRLCKQAGLSVKDFGFDLG